MQTNRKGYRVERSRLSAWDLTALELCINEAIKNGLDIDSDGLGFLLHRLQRADGGTLTRRIATQNGTER